MSAGLEIHRHPEAVPGKAMTKEHDCVALLQCLQWWMTSLPEQATPTANELFDFVKGAEESMFVARTDSKLFGTHNPTRTGSPTRQQHHTNESPPIDEVVELFSGLTTNP